MGMNVGGGGEDEAMMDINTTPLIDVMLVLIIMLIITIPIQTHAVKLDMPSATPPQTNTTPPEVVNIMVDFDNTIQWNGTTVDRQNLELRLRDAALKNPQPEVHLWPNKLAKYNTVAMVMASAQRLGVTKLGLVGAEQFMD
ncbi:biopolymer transport exbD1 protein [Nitrospirillum viridazoti Y2]|uniref:Outer membrane transport energization protein ExbD n=1 Tax=Nitrospirillum amazonense TaxID=28077 RepID=A0A560ISW9_9PROT|nr:biopolymer transporter ExbD [Nitrospirillum amazonense]EGY02113.1 biopolymer transport exbD1 protein [Nitrospirillum amazonense Y2]TWB62163.1 outer membrane transport energization protein ExbD [Nitrospirillum amazonense]